MGHVSAPREIIVALPEEIDMYNAAWVAAELTSAISHSSTVIADLSATRFCGCAGARAVLQAYVRAADNDAELRLVVTAELVRRMFGLMGVGGLLDIYPSVAAARRASRWRLPDQVITSGPELD